MNRLGRSVAVALLILATAVLAIGCTEDGSPDGSMVSTTVSTGDGPGGDGPGGEAPESPTTTEAATTTQAPDTTQPPSDTESSTSADDSSDTAIWIGVIAVVVLVAVGAWLIGRGRSTETTTEATTQAVQPPPPPPATPIDEGDAHSDPGGGESGA